MRFRGTKLMFFKEDDFEKFILTHDPESRRDPLQQGCQQVLVSYEVERVLARTD